ncbi:MAG: polysaccharide biosynthesis C-terminal domain-containing protein [Geobacteraceae bacterium]|nr:polysaccharide biosynthesis C-terminal domain-containing protein [Geobacteraceae bacterium]
MGKHGRRIIGHSGIYLLGSLLARAVSFIMLPIYTRNLTPADYGVIELLSMVIDLVGLLLSLRIGQSIYRYYFKYDREEDRNQVLFSSYVTTLASSLLGMVCVLVFADQLASAVFGNGVHMVGLLRLFSLSMVFQGLVETPMVMLRAQQKPWLYLVASITKLVIMLGLNIYFVVFRQLHVEGVIYSALISGAIMTLLLGFYLIRNTGICFSFSKAKEMMGFSLPFMAVGALSFYINFGDRYFLRLFGGGLDQVGVYSLGYKFGFLLTFIAGDPFFNVWDSEKFRIYKEHENPAAVYRSVFLIYAAILAIVAIGISLFGRNVIMIMANREYWRAAELIPVVCLAYIFNCITGYGNMGILVKDRTIEFTYGSIIAAIVVSAGYLLLIPRFGAMGAAWATLLAFAARMVWVLVRSRKYYDMQLEWGRVLGLGAVAGLIWKFSDILRSESIFLSLMTNTVAVAVCVFALLYLPFLPADLRKEAREMLFDPRSSLLKLKGLIGAR